MLVMMRGGVKQIRKLNMFQKMKAEKMGSVRMMYLIRSGVPSVAKEPRQPKRETGEKKNTLGHLANAQGQRS